LLIFSFEARAPITRPNEKIIIYFSYPNAILSLLFRPLMFVCLMTPYGGIMELPFLCLPAGEKCIICPRTISPLLRVLNGEECIVENVIIGGLEQRKEPSAVAPSSTQHMPHKTAPTH
jgi:hypothetical protein